MANITANIQDIIDEIKADANDDQLADITSASIDVVLAAAKLIGLYKDYYSKGNKKILYNGERHTMTEWAKITGIPMPTLRKRILQNHWDIADAIETPVQNSSLSRNFKMQVVVLQYNCKRELMQEFKSINEAARQLGIDRTLVNKAIEGMDPLEQVGMFGYYLTTPKKQIAEVEDVG